MWEEEIDNFDVFGTDADGDKCYILEVDLHYPDHLHDKHNDYPLAGLSNYIVFIRKGVIRVIGTRIPLNL